MTPVEYAERYLNLEVPFDSGPTTVHVTKYHMGNPDTEQGQLWQALKEHFAGRQKKDPSYKLKLRVNQNTEEFSSAQEMLHRAVNPFWGKGSPEDCQIVLQLAVLLRGKKKSELQGYCDAHLGLDCNGFIGNYIARVLQQGGWRGDAADGAPGPSATITQIMNITGGRAIKTVGDMVPGSTMYLLGEVDTHYRVIPGGNPADPGHIVITEPGRFMPRSFVFDSFGGLDLGLAEKDAYGHPAFWGVESTGVIGLTQSWYAIKPLMKGKSPVEGVFRVFRGSKDENRNFRIVALPS
jgi:hypothetical protein